MEDSPKKRSFSKSRKDSPAKSSRSRRTSDNETSKRKRTDNKPYQRKEYDERPPRRDSGDRPPRREYGDRPPRRDSGDRPPRRDSGDRPPRRDSGDRPPRRDSGDRPPRREYSDRPPRRDSGDRPPRREYSDRPPRRDSGDRPPRRDSGDRPPRREYSDRPPRRDSGDRPPRREYEDRPPRREYGDRPPRRDAEDRPPRREYGDRPLRKDFEEKPQRKRRNITAESPILTEIVEKRIREGRQAPKKQKILSLEYEEQYGPIRLNKYISNAGICSRRDADNLIISGAITVNGKVVSELGTKVMPTDEIRFGDKVLQREKPVYLLLNKPKDYITTTDDEFDRKDVMELVRGACKERIYPVGRLDKNTTGLLLFTNDGEMTKKLTHPKHLVLKTYHVELNKNMTGSDFETLLNGIELDDGIIKPDELAYVNDSKNELGITIHSGKNRIVRRIFESLGYDVIKLDRVVFAGLTKKNLPRGKWRFLSQEETNYLKMI